MKDGSSNSHSSDVEYLESKNFLTWLSELEDLSDFFPELLLQKVIRLVKIYMDQVYNI